jgi:hypothetical protein
MRCRSARIPDVPAQPTRDLRTTITEASSWNVINPFEPTLRQMVLNILG